MNITTPRPNTIAIEHPQYIDYAPRWTRMADALMDEDAVKAKRAVYLPKTGGMAKNDHNEAQYNAYLMRARFPEITSQGLTGIVGLVFEKDPEGVSDEIITNTNQNNVQLARECMRAVASKGRDILVVDAPRAPSGGMPFISRYSAESLINWKVEDDNPARLRLAVFKEEDSSIASEYGHETRETYRKYERLEGTIWVSRWMVEGERDILIEEPIALPVPFMPIVIPGSIDLKPNCDQIPLLPVARCAFSYYLKSASFEHALYLTSQPTPWLMGVDEDQYIKIQQQGIGSSALWYLGENGAAGFLQTASDPAPLERAMQAQLDQAETYAVRLTQSDSTPESGTSLAMRAATQHASIYSMSDSVSIAMREAIQMRAVWGSMSRPDDFALRTDFDSQYAGEQMINALNSAVNAGNAPRTALYEAIRRSGLSELDDAGMDAEIETQQAAAAESAAQYESLNAPQPGAAQV